MLEIYFIIVIPLCNDSKCKIDYKILVFVRSKEFYQFLARIFYCKENL